MSQDASRTEAVEAGVLHEQSERAPHHKHVTADEISPDHLAQQANADVVVGDPPSAAAIMTAVVVAVLTLVAVLAVALALH